MIIFLDASAIVALLAREPEAGSFDHFVTIYPDRVSSAIAVWEASRGLAKARDIDFEESRALVAKFIDVMNIRLVPIGAEEVTLALDAHERYGKGRHCAKLNMGDCFAYACTKRFADIILFKGEDFTHTDLMDATLA